ncbi:hypothetical protein NDU88_004320 [Pleurodeles waltl]|uniref:Uncharacterized protein n=1 Tax=Pleurodeles waltl TaxID=8319 RepID=A0AAV7NJG1_PLEWA|nr:hypothetical protein NDU88_004320 [Pleurodeles waltl]
MGRGSSIEVFHAHDPCNRTGSPRSPQLSLLARGLPGPLDQPPDPLKGAPLPSGAPGTIPADNDPVHE